MASHFMVTRVPEWADGLSQEIIDVVRQEAMRRGIATRDLVREWTLDNARKLIGETAEPLAASSPTGSEQ